MLQSTEVDAIQSSPRRYVVTTFVMVSVCVAIGLLYIVFLNTPPKEFNQGARITIEHGSSLRTIAHTLKQQGIVRDSLLFHLLITYRGAAQSLYAGEYQFDIPMSTIEVAEAMIQKTAIIPPVRITIPEGTTLAGFDAIISTALPRIEAGGIIKAASGTEAVLFPDTYLIPETYTAHDIVNLLDATFKEKLQPYNERIIESGFSLHEVLTLASLIEREANDRESMRMISGILQNRLRINMPLQVDAVFMYLLRKTSAELTPEDLELDSPYNTYTHTGLPPGPIASPSLKAIEAVLSPITSQNLYYLTGSDGVFYYALTFEEHKLNKERYLR